MDEKTLKEIKEEVRKSNTKEVHTIIEVETICEWEVTHIIKKDLVNDATYHNMVIHNGVITASVLPFVRHRNHLLEDESDHKIKIYCPLLSVFDSVKNSNEQYKWMVSHVSKQDIDSTFFANPDPKKHFQGNLENNRVDVTEKDIAYVNAFTRVYHTVVVMSPVFKREYELRKELGMDYKYIGEE